MGSDEAAGAGLRFNLDREALMEAAETAGDPLETGAGVDLDADLIPALGLDPEAVGCGVLGDDGAVDVPERRLRRDREDGERQGGDGRERSDAFAEHVPCLSVWLVPGHRAYGTSRRQVQTG